MSTYDKRLVRRYCEKVVNTGELDDIERFIAPEYIEAFEDMRHSMGLEGAIAHVRGVPTPTMCWRWASRLRKWWSAESS